MRKLRHRLSNLSKVTWLVTDSKLGSLPPQPTFLPASLQRCPLGTSTVDSNRKCLFNAHDNPGWEGLFTDWKFWTDVDWLESVGRSWRKKTWFRASLRQFPHLPSPSLPHPYLSSSATTPAYSWTPKQICSFWAPQESWQKTQGICGTVAPLGICYGPGRKEEEI